MASSKKTTKKTLRLKVQQQLTESLTDLQPGLGKNQFKSNIKKAAKILLKGYKDSKTDSLKKSIPGPHPVKAIEEIA